MANKTDYTSLYRKKRETVTDKVLEQLDRAADERENHRTENAEHPIETPRAGSEPIVQEVKQDIEFLREHAYKEEYPEVQEADKEPKISHTENLSTPKTAEIPQNKGGRPRKYNEPMKWIKIQLTETNYNYLKQNGGIYDGMNGFINHLIDESRLKG